MPQETLARMAELSGVTVVVTRPAHQAENLCHLIEAAGGHALRFPVIEIAPPKDADVCKAQLAQLADADLAIFVSANAVTAVLAILESPSSWPSHLAVAAVGKATAQALAAHGVTTSLVAPPPFNSEALLCLPELQTLQGQRVVIVRGKGGRELLGESLRERGAEVEYIECYERVIPQMLPEAKKLLSAWNEGRQLPIVVTSNEGLENLLTMAGADYRAALLSSPLILISERTAELAKNLGFSENLMVAESANDESILTAIKTWARS